MNLKDILVMPDPEIRHNMNGPSWIEECEKRFQEALREARQSGLEDAAQLMDLYESADKNGLHVSCAEFIRRLK